MWFLKGFGSICVSADMNEHEPSSNFLESLLYIWHSCILRMLKQQYCVTQEAWQTT